jgi:hypothetical protein
MLKKQKQQPDNEAKNGHDVKERKEQMSRQIIFLEFLQTNIAQIAKAPRSNASIIACSIGAIFLPNKEQTNKGYLYA